MSKFTEMQSFVLIAEKGSLASAAAVQNITPVVMGRRLSSLERSLGVQLAHRSTQGVVLTDLGQQYLEQCIQILEHIDTADTMVSKKRKTLVGRLVVAAPAGFGRQHVAPHILEFKRRYPDLKLSFNFSDSVIDLVDAGYDMAIRVGQVLDLNYVATRLYPNRRVVCGTPAYFAKYGVPQTPQDLQNHNCLAFNNHGGQPRGWLFMQDGKMLSQRVQGDLDSNDGELLYEWVRQGMGVAWRSSWEIRKELKTGELITVLDDYAAPDYDIRAVYPQQKYLPTKVRYFIDYLHKIYNRVGYWDT